MCEYCEKDKFNQSIIRQDPVIKGIEVVIEPPAIVLSVNGFRRGKLINYCPMCGRKLVDE